MILTDFDKIQFLNKNMNFDTLWASIRIFFILQDRELQELRHIINNLKEKNEMGDQSKSITKCPKKSFTIFFFSHLFQCLLDGSRMITCSILKMRPLMISMDIRFREVGPRGLLSEVEGKILG